MSSTHTPIQTPLLAGYYNITKLTSSFSYENGWLTTAMGYPPVPSPLSALLFDYDKTRQAALVSGLNYNVFPVALPVILNCYIAFTIWSLCLSISLENATILSLTILFVVVIALFIYSRDWTKLLYTFLANLKYYSIF